MQRDLLRDLGYKGKIQNLVLQTLKTIKNKHQI